MIKDYEPLSAPLAPRRKFLQRLSVNTLLASAVIGLSLVAGMVGYHALEGMTWLDAFANAAMILSGMGPLSAMTTASGKLFAGCYALYSGLLLIFITGLILAPVAHRILHRLHVKDED